MNYLLSIHELDKYERGEGVAVQGIDASDSDWAVLNGMCAQLDGDVRTLATDYVGLASNAAPADLARVAAAQAAFIDFQTRWNAFNASMKDRGGLFALDYANSVHQFVTFRDEYQEKRKALIAFGVTPTAADRPFLPPPAAKSPWGLPSLPTWTWVAVGIGLLVVVGPFVAGPFAYAATRRL